MTNETLSERSGYPIILNGDHAEFEAEHAGMNPKDRPDWPLPSFDARDWAKAYMNAWPQGCADEGTMVTWFACALMRGFDERASRSAEHPTPQPDDRDEALRATLQKAYVALMNAHCVIESHLGDLEDDPKSNPEYVAVIRKEEANAKAALAAIAAAKSKGGEG